MGKVVVVGLIAAAAWVGWVFHSEGADNAFGGIFAPIESVRDSESNPALGLTGAAQSADVPTQPRSNAGRITQDVRNKLDRSFDGRR